MKTKSQRLGASQYDALAELYDAYFSGKDPLERVEDLLAQYPPPAKILDCACGTGRLALGLAERGYRAFGSDASAGMIKVARANGRAAKSKARFKEVEWSRLPRVFPQGFDLIFCLGNAIGHCRNEAEMLRALKGMFAVLKPGGILHLDSRCWETDCRQRLRYRAFPIRVCGKEKLAWLNVWQYSRVFTDPHLIEVVIIQEKDNASSVKSFPITYYPFRVGDLKRRLRASGFADIQTDYEPGCNWYRVTARKKRIAGSSSPNK
jgi:SAM-dependent methyltransferase